MKDRRWPVSLSTSPMVIRTCRLTRSGSSWTTSSCRRQQWSTRPRKKRLPDRKLPSPRDSRRSRLSLQWCAERLISSHIEKGSTESIWNQLARVRETCQLWIYPRPVIAIYHPFRRSLAAAATTELAEHLKLMKIRKIAQELAPMPPVEPIRIHCSNVFSSPPRWRSLSCRGTNTWLTKRWRRWPVNLPNVQLQIWNEHELAEKTDTNCVIMHFLNK